MANQLKQILQELYELDPELKKYEAELLVMIKKIMANKPDTKFDKQFAKRLRAELLKSNLTTNNASQTNSLIDLFTMKKLAYVLGGAVLTALVLIPLLNTPQTKNILNLNPNQQLAFDTSLKVDQIGAEAFGPLTSDNAGQTYFTADGEESGTSSVAPVPLGAPVRDQSGGGSATTALGLGGGAGVDAKMIAPDFIAYQFVYKGDELTLDESAVNVLKRIKGFGNQDALNGLISGFNLGLLDLNSFGRLNVDNLTLTETDRYGYMINIQANEGMISMNKNWLAWPQVLCTDPNCDNLRIRENQMPADEVAIKMANDFLAQHNINLAGYGSPEVQKGWQMLYEQTAVKTDFWFPEFVNVVYPLEISGQQVYEQYSTDKAGLIVNIDVRENRVGGFSGLTNQNYQSSSYAAETDAQKIITVAERGGINAGWWAPEGSATQEIELGTPVRQLIKYYRYRDNQTEELFVPALVFPVTNKPDNYYGAQQIVVPLAAELLNEVNGGPIRIMPAPLPAQTEPGSEPQPAIIEEGVEELK